MLDLERLQSKLDKQLESETVESLSAWVQEQQEVDDRHATSFSDLDPRFKFLFQHNNIIHSRLARMYEREANSLDEILFSATHCAKFLRKTMKELQKNYPSEFQEGGILHNFNPEELYDYVTAVYGWELPHGDIVNSIFRFCSTSTPILEVGSGCGLFSRILSKNFVVYPTDIQTNQNCERNWMTPIIYPSSASIPNNPHAFIFCTWPHKDMLIDILNLSSVGQRIGLMIPPMAGISSDCIKAILEQFKLLDKLYSITHQNYATREYMPPEWQGVIIEKTRPFEFNGDYTREADCSIYSTWQDAVDGIKQER